jgi:hypothetical protein
MDTARVEAEALDPSQFGELFNKLAKSVADLAQGGGIGDLTDDLVCMAAVFCTTLRGIPGVLAALDSVQETAPTWLAFRYAMTGASFTDVMNKLEQDLTVSRRFSLYNCPFCGDTAQSGVHPEMSDSFWAGCIREACPGEQAAFDYSTEEGAVNAWNTRAPSPPASPNPYDYSRIDWDNWDPR